MQNDKVVGWEKLGGEGNKFPMLFHDVHDGNQWAALLQNDTPSYQNVREAEEIVKIVVELCSEESLDVVVTDIAVVTPFRAQVLLIRNLLRDVNDGKLNYFGVNVGQVEDLQGQEARIVIVSSVLSKWEGREEGEEGEEGEGRGAALRRGERPLGFLGNPSKFNVAISRAKSLLIVVGKMDFLYDEQHGSYWRLLIEHCRRNKAITRKGGGRRKRQEEEEEEKGEEKHFGISKLIENAKEMALGGKSNDDMYGLALRGYSDSPEWRITI